MVQGFELGIKTSSHWGHHSTPTCTNRGEVKYRCTTTGSSMDAAASSTSSIVVTRRIPRPRDEPTGFKILGCGAVVWEAVVWKAEWKAVKHSIDTYL